MRGRGVRLQLRDRLEHDLGGARHGAPPTASESPNPKSSITSGSQATTNTRPGQPPTYLTNRSTVWGSMPCGSSVCPSSI